jgi:hypothetical protein
LGLFNIIINNNINLKYIETQINTLYTEKELIFGSSDTLFIGSQKAIDYLFDLPNYYKNYKIYGDEIWSDEKFVNFLYNMDSCLYNCRATYSPEIQYISHVYFSTSFKYKNIRFDYNNPKTEYNNDTLYNIILYPNRRIFNVNKKTIIILTKNYIDYINKKINPEFLHYYSPQGLIDYNMEIGKEHYKLLCCLSKQIKNSIIFDIGTHNGNLSVSLGYSLTNNSNNNKFYSFDIKDFRDIACKKFFNDYSINYCLENICDIVVREKYSKLLLESSLIMFDIDPHNGILEYEIYVWLRDNNYKGLILYDDIFLNKGHISNGYKSTDYNMVEF